MERKSLKPLFFICLVLGLLVGQSTAINWCFIKCFAPCILFHSAPECMGKCGQKCVTSPSPPSLASVRDKNYYCTLGCATSFCTQLSTVAQRNDGKEKVDAKEKMDGCVDSCAVTCSKN